MRKPTVIVIGNGTSALSACKHLAKYEVNVVLISDFLGYMNEYCVTRYLSGRSSLEGSCVPWRVAFKNKNVKTVIDTVKEVKVSSNTVICERQSLMYDFLVIANGLASRVEERHTSFCNGKDAVQIKKMLLKNWQRAENEEDRAERDRLLCMAVIGGSKNGCMLASCVRDLAKKELKYYKNITPEDVRIVLVEKGERLVGKFPERVAKAVDEYLIKKDVEIVYKKRLDDVGPGMIVLDRGLPIWAATIVFAHGNTIHCFHDEIERDAKGRVVVNDTLQSSKDNVFAIGGCASITWEHDVNVSNADQMAKTCAENINNMINGFVLKKHKKYFSKDYIDLGGASFCSVEWVNMGSLLSRFVILAHKLKHYPGNRFVYLVKNIFS